MQPSIEVRALHKRYRGNGYMHVSEKVDREVHDADHTVDVVVTIDQGPQYRFGKLKIDGLDILSEPEIRKMWGDHEGKPFQPDFPDSFLARVREEGIFENLGKTRAETDIDEASKIVDVTLHFTGGKPDSEKEGRRRQLPCARAKVRTSDRCRFRPSSSASIARCTSSVARHNFDLARFLYSSGKRAAN